MRVLSLYWIRLIENIANKKYARYQDIGCREMSSESMNDTVVKKISSWDSMKKS